MRIVQELISTDMGLAALAIILFMTGMGAFIYFFIKHQMKREKDAAGSAR